MTNRRGICSSADRSWKCFFDLLRAQALQGVAAAVDAHRCFEGLFGTVTVAAVDEDLAVVVERCSG
jgi:hypothetical protein